MVGQQDCADGLNKIFFVLTAPKRTRKLDLDTLPRLALVTDVIPVSSFKSMAICFDSKTSLPKGFCNTGFKFNIQPSKQDPFVVTSTAVHRNYEGAFADERKTGRLVESMACDMKRCIVVRSFDSFKQVQIELVTGYSSYDISSPDLDLASVRRDHSNVRRGAANNGDCIVDTFLLMCRKMSKVFVSVPA